MTIEIRVPRLGWSMEEGTFVEWLKRDGESIRLGDPLFALEGDKAIQEIESVGAGILRISPQAPENGDRVLVGALLAVVLEPGETWDFTSAASAAVTDHVDSDDGAAAGSRTVPSGATAAVESSAFQEPRKGGRVRVSPRAARVASELGVDLARVPGTGRNGRIRERDVRSAVSGASAVRNSPIDANRTAESPASMPGFRKTIATRMTEGAHATAPVTLTTSADATNLVSLRSQFKAAGAGMESAVTIPSYSDVVIKLVARALAEHPALNQQWIDGRIESPDGIHIALAIDTPNGLLAAVIRDVNDLGLREIATRTTDLKERALSSQLKPDELRGGTFTVTNLGAYGIDAFTPIINVPQCAILGLGRIARRPEVIGDRIEPRDSITLSLTFDHRIVDGAPAARFLATLRGAIENPGPWLVF